MRNKSRNWRNNSASRRSSEPRRSSSRNKKYLRKQQLTQNCKLKLISIKLINDNKLLYKH